MTTFFFQHPVFVVAVNEKPSPDEADGEKTPAVPISIKYSGPYPLDDDLAIQACPPPDPSKPRTKNLPTPYQGILRSRFIGIDLDEIDAVARLMPVFLDHPVKESTEESARKMMAGDDPALMLVGAVHLDKAHMLRPGDFFSMLDRLPEDWVPGLVYMAGQTGGYPQKEEQFAQAVTDYLKRPDSRWRRAVTRTTLPLIEKAAKESVRWRLLNGPVFQAALERLKNEQ